MHLFDLLLFGAFPYGASSKLSFAAGRKVLPRQGFGGESEVPFAPFPFPKKEQTV